MQHNSSWKAGEFGFTLVELMVVVAISMILAAIAIDCFHSYHLRAKRSELLLNLKAIYLAEKTFQTERDRFKSLAPSPRPVAALSPVKVTWRDNGGFDSIGWRPSGLLYGTYQAAVVGTAVVAGDARSDIDGDGNDARATFYVDRAAPQNNQGVRMVSANSFF